MDRYITLTAATKRVVDEAFDLAPQMWGHGIGAETVDLSNVRIATGNYAGYGNYVARAFPSVGVIEIPTNPRQGLLRLTREGFDAKNDVRLRGTIIHELGHIYQHALDAANWDGLCAGSTTHSLPSWVWICFHAWTYVHGELDFSIEDLAWALRQRDRLSHFSPYRLLKLSDQEIRAARHCSWCSEPFIAKRKTARFCSASCRVAHNRKNQRLVAEAAAA